ncbi:methylglyoxal synthase [Thiospirochaeta perfilievii]|uniref:Methylglyoxal synthase n=1 Tax=Thiospirochaeta perfilievii TaxID=252967 RepID=A0A5C1QF57_9SPIO|nr:methylglyoxal synthase [Thiospirochaeta perfilievii]QEN05284.1 methylglyoxal synthase [Thiospirochaeta perfilievii]
MNIRKTIALVAHDNRKPDLLEWVDYNWQSLQGHKIICTGTTGSLIQEKFNQKLKGSKEVGPEIIRLKSGPLGGDQQLGSLICTNEIDIMIFLWDPMEPQPHDVDVKALERIAVLYNIPYASNRASADFLISSELFKTGYKPKLKDYSSYINRKI